MKPARLIAAAALAATAAGALARPVSAPAGPSPAQLVAARQAGMDMAATSLNLLRGGSTNGMPLKSLTFAATGLAKWAQVMPALFPASTRGEISRTRPEAWTNPADFASKSAAFSSATKSLAAAAAAEDKDAFAAALASTAAACKGCHDSYQVPPPAKPVG